MPVRKFFVARSMSIFMALAGAGCLALAIIAINASGKPTASVAETPVVEIAVAATDQTSEAKAEAKAESELVGIGAALKSVDGYMEIHKIIPGSAADLDGRLKKGDVIVGVGQGTSGEIEEIAAMKVTDVVGKIRGKSDTVVRIEVMPVSEPRQTVVYAITRARIELNNSGARGEVLDTPNDEGNALATPTRDKTIQIKANVENELATKSDAKAEEPNAAAKAVASPTHHQTAIIQANVENLPNTKLKCFALTPEGQVLAGCTGESGEIRVFDNQGDYVETWSIAVQPEAMYVRGDGMVFVAGEGELLKLDGRGNLVKQSPAPHADALQVNTDDLRKEVIARAKQMAGRLAQQGQMYDRVIQQTQQQIEQIRKAADEADSDQQATAERRIASLEKRIKQYEQVKARWEESQTDRQPAELTEEQIEQQIQAAIQYKTAASSISATDSNVYVATRSKVGYGFQVWRMDDEFQNGETIISGLSGCCGQMDVKVNDQGVFVAENSKHRVCRYDNDGKLVTTWGSGDRTSLEGFGSCCNPMNVAFGPEEVVYTAEDNTGRIKRYSPDGKLLGLVGSVDLVPGCKNCSIAVGPGGDQVYMLDITRNHIVRMDRYAPGEAPAPVASAGAVRGQATQPANGGQLVVRGLTNLFRLGATKPAPQAEADADE